MLLKETSKNKNNQELVKASIDALVKSLEAGHSEVLSSYLTAMAQFHNYSFQNFSEHSFDRQPAAQGYQSCRHSGMESEGKMRRKGHHDFCPFD